MGLQIEQWSKVMMSVGTQNGLLGLGISLGLAASAMGGVLAVDTTGTARNGKVGHFSSMVASANEEAVSYYCEQDPSGPLATSFAVRFAWKTGGADGCWQVTNIGDFGSYTSMKRDTGGVYHILYAGWNGLAWATGAGRTWTIAPDRVDSVVAPGEVAMVLDAQNRPHVAYYDSDAPSGRALKYTEWNGTQWMRGPSETIAMNAWTPTISPGNTFLALDSAGVPHVTFAQPVDAVNAVGDIKYATLQNGAWTIESLGIVGENPSLMIGTDNVPRIAFQGGLGLTYAYKSGGVWVTEDVPTFGSWPNSVTMALGPNNSPSIGFAMTANEDMYLATRGTGGWNVAMVDGDGLPNGDLILGRLGVGLAVDPAGQPHMSYWAVTIYNLPNNTTDHHSDLRYYTSGNAGTICPESPGACCDPATLACSISLPSACAGTFNGAAACAPNPCDPSVACCDPGTSACSVVLRSQCTGTFYAAAACTPNPCDPMVACCDAASGACTLLAASACTGTLGGSTSCTPNPCPQPPPPGACCNASTGACSLLTATACTGTWNGAASCSPNPCPQPTGVGACCEGGTSCSVMPIQDCDHGVFQGVGVACGIGDNHTTCCPANFNLLNGLTVQDIFDFLNAWFASDVRCDFNHVDGVNVQDIFDFLNAWFAGCH
jgi:hypothetical protein